MSRWFRSLDDGDFASLFRDFEFTAYRLETLQRYDVAYEQQEFARFLAGETEGEFPGIRAWCDTVREAVASGKRMHRVHVVAEPLSDYLRFECGWGYEHTVEAGEDVRLLPVLGDDWPALPRYDYWLFDSSRLVAMHYDEGGGFRGGELVTDTDRIVEANYWRDLAVHAAVPYREYAASSSPR